MCVQKITIQKSILRFGFASISAPERVYPEHNKSENQNAFYLHEDMGYYGGIQPKFKKIVKDFAKRKYGKLSKAPNGKPLGVHYRTMEGW